MTEALLKVHAARGQFVAVSVTVTRPLSLGVTRGDINDNTSRVTDESDHQLSDHHDAEQTVSASPRPSTADILRAELAAVLASADFMRAPTMNRLLAYLVTETAEGRADQLKAYSVAIDGLGRAPDYDARADSYPRVQVGRLRRMLDTYYASAPTITGYRLAIPSGRYRVTLVSDIEPLAEPEAETSPAASAEVRFTREALVRTLLLLTLAILIAGALAYLTPAPRTPFSDGREKPLLEFTAASHGPLKSTRGDLVGATLINGLGRSDMFDLRIARRSGSGSAGNNGPREVPAPYRLSTDLLDGPQSRLFLRLWHQQPDRLLWSGDVALPPRSAPEQAVEEALRPVIATIGRVNGLVAMHEFQQHAAQPPNGHRCILLYYRYRKERLANEREPVRECIDRSIAQQPGNAALQAVAAQLALDRVASSRTPAMDRADWLAAARRHAQLAISIDPLNSWAIVARARIAALRHTCPLAVSNAVRASELQPFDPTLLSEVGLILVNCSDRRAEAIIRRAIAMDDGTDGQFYRPLLVLAISRDDPGVAREALSAMTPPVLGRHGAFYILTAIGYAMTDNAPLARAAWRQLRASSPSMAADPAGYFDRLGLDAAVRDKALQHLRSARLIA